MLKANAKRKKVTSDGDFVVMHALLSFLKAFFLVGQCAQQGGRTRLPKFKFSANFPIGLHVILQIQIKENKKYLISYVKKYFNRKSVEVQC